MREIKLRVGESITIGDTTITAVKSTEKTQITGSVPASRIVEYFMSAPAVDAAVNSRIGPQHGFFISPLVSAKGCSDA